MRRDCFDWRRDPGPCIVCGVPHTACCAPAPSTPQQTPALIARPVGTTGLVVEARTPSPKPGRSR